MALGLSCMGIVLSSRMLLHVEAHPGAWWKFACCGLVGLTNAMLFLQLAQCDIA